MNSRSSFSFVQSPIGTGEPTLSVGVLGMLSYAALFGFYWWRGMLRAIGLTSFMY
ncbi:hypothetical protein IQ264_24075 [Phormidium sp. LEGE 05292]|uniref:hypothetical protein n=1 Tax=[Phormidium] sp. LEGE 05292 TaxID=767427 RepID=UPI00187F8B8E|nr:hypothetical protein [Phormidium sp. LEGE 05292]MBE9228499.1 hypothetical protein [Phormidium sp. LEGE 05292]